MEQSFRTAMFGFNKEDVAKYTFQQSKSFEKKLADKEAALEKANAALTQAESDSVRQADNVERVRELRSLLERLQEQWSTVKANIDQEDADLDAMENEYSTLEDRCVKLEAFREKAQKFDSLASALSGIFGNGAADGCTADDIGPQEKPVVSSVQYAKLHWEEKRDAVGSLDDTVQQIAALIAEILA